jgi:molybdopterin-guanine dinucleotide biosynthesis protein A
VTRLLGAILAGGQSRRFGSDKAMASHAGRPLIAHIIEALEPQVDAVILCGRTLEGVAHVADRPEAGLGPMGGINAALHYAAANGFDAVLTCGCDTPLLPADLGERLAAAGEAVFVEDLPVIGRWPARLAEQIDRHLQEGDDRSIRRWARSIGAVAITLPDAVPNINTPEDLARLGGA